MGVLPVLLSWGEVPHACQTIGLVRGQSRVGAADCSGAPCAQPSGVRVRGEDTEDSDLDLLVDTSDTTSLFDLAAIELELEALLGCPVHVTTDGGLRGALRERVLADAGPV